MKIKIQEVEKYSIVNVFFVKLSVQIQGELLKPENSIGAFLVSSKCCNNFVYFDENQIDFVNKENGQITIFLNNIK